jgi:ketosteroid isomerase-like protein
MRVLTLGAVVGICVAVVGGPAVRAQSPDPKLMAPINKFLEAFNKGDLAGIASTHAADGDVAIVDEVSPFLWRGPQAIKSWLADLDADAKKQGMTDMKVTLSRATRVETAGQNAYVVVPAVFTFKAKGVDMRENAQMTLVLKDSGSGWLIHAWTWTGPRPQKAATASK